MPRPTSDTSLAVLVLATAALVLVAPVAGRVGFERLADACMALAAAGGFLSFGLAAAHTIRAARRRAPARSRREPT